MTTHDDFTAEQRAEWAERMAELQRLTEAYHRERDEAASALVYAVRTPASAEWAQGDAMEHARAAVALWEQRMEASARCDATEYGAWMRAELDANLARRKAAKSVTA